MTRALVRRPGPRLADGLVTFQDRVPVDLELAVRQWQGYVAALADFGWEIVEVPPADDCADAVFVEDTVVMYDDLAVLTRPGAPERRFETEGPATVLSRLGHRVERLEAPATLDGGDVLKHGRDVWVGLSGRTNAAGAAALAAVVEPLAARVHSVPVTRVLHLKTALTALPDGTFVGYRDHVDEPDAWPGFLPLPEPAGGLLLVLDEETVLMSASAPRSKAVLEDRGWRVVAVDIGELEKLEGSVTCLSVRLRHAP
jgi:dimethylargininase